MAKKPNYADLFTRRKDGRYQGSYTDDRGRHYVYDRDPEALWHRLEALRCATPPVITFRQVAEEWEREHREEITPRTWNNYAPHVTAVVAKYGDLPLDEVTAMDVSQTLQQAKRQGLSATVVNTIRSIFRMIFDYGIAQGYSKFNPVSAVRLPKGLPRGKRKAPTEEQMRTICANVDAPFGLFPFLLLCTGLRKSEALALTWADIDFDAAEISITKSLVYLDGANPDVKAPKTDAGIRSVPILDVLAAPLRQAWENRTSDYVFSAPPSPRGGKGGGAMTERGYEGAWLRYCRAAGLMDGNKPAITAHNLRHGTATLMFELGVDELTAQRILGHSRIEITREIYTDLRNAQRAKSVRRLNEGMSNMMSNLE